MRKITAVFVILSAFMLLPGLAHAQHPHDITEYIAITATAATADQTSAMIKKPMGAKGVFTWLATTAGSTLLLDVNIYGHSPTVNAYGAYAINCPSDGGITGTGNSLCVWVDGGSTTDYGVQEKLIALPTYFRFLVNHGNTNAATYILYYQWMW